LLIASAFNALSEESGECYRKRKRNSWACKQTIDQSQLGDKREIAEE